MCGDLVFAYPLEQRARPHLQVLGSLICGKPFGFHVSLFSRSGNAGSRRFVDGYVMFLSSLRIELLRILVASTSDLVEQVMGAVLTPSLLLTTRSLSPRSALSYKGTSGFIAKCLPDCEPDAEGGVLALRTSIADAPSASLFSFFM